MDDRSIRRARRLILALAAVAGVVAAHALEYTAAHVDAPGRADHLHATGHGYWPAAVLVAMAAGLLGTGLAAGSAIRRALDRHDGVHPQGRTLPRLGSLAMAQGGLFAVMEVVERTVVGADLSELVRTPWFALGLLLQVLVAAAVVVVLRVITAGAERLTAAARRRRRGRAVVDRWARRAWWMPAAAVLAGEGGRGPPVLLRA